MMSEKIVPAWEFGKVVGLPFPQIQGALPFQSENKRAAYSPFSAETFTLDNAVMAIAIMKLIKTPDGVKTIEKLFIKHMESLTKMLDSIEGSGNTNWVTAGYSQIMASNLLHRFGLVNDGDHLRLTDHVRVTFDKMWQSGFINDTVGSLTTMVAGSRINEGKEGMSAGGLAAILKGLK